jgi:glycosyltransferase involved in cell wall biosynthesis
VDRGLRTRDTPLRALRAPNLFEWLSHKVYEMKLEEIALIVPTKNEERNIGKFLSSLPPNLWLTVVDASDDQTAARIRKLRPARTNILHEPCNVSTARQWGAEQAHTRWLLFSDADVVFPQSYFERLSALAEGDVIFGPNLPTDQFKCYYLRLRPGVFPSPPDPFGQWLQSVNSPDGLGTRWGL